jgi:hypothetical protein
VPNGIAPIPGVSQLEMIAKIRLVQPFPNVSEPTPKFLDFIPQLPHLACQIPSRWIFYGR